MTILRRVRYILRVHCRSNSVDRVLAEVDDAYYGIQSGGSERQLIDKEQSSKKTPSQSHPLRVGVSTASILVNPNTGLPFSKSCITALVVKISAHRTIKNTVWFNLV